MWWLKPVIPALSGLSLGQKDGEPLPQKTKETVCFQIWCDSETDLISGFWSSLKNCTRSLCFIISSLQCGKQAMTNVTNSALRAFYFNYVNKGKAKLIFKKLTLQNSRAVLLPLERDRGLSEAPPSRDSATHSLKGCARLKENHTWKPAPVRTSANPFFLLLFPGLGLA